MHCKLYNFFFHWLARAENNASFTDGFDDLTIHQVVLCNWIKNGYQKHKGQIWGQLISNVASQCR